MSKAHNEPAFPIAETDPNMGTRACPGMSIWDYFAAAALNQRKMLSTGAYYAADAAREAAEIADAMCAERAKRRQG